MTFSDGGIFRAAPSDTGAYQTGGVLPITGAPAVHRTYPAFLSPLRPAFSSMLALGTAADFFGSRGAFTASAIVPSLGLPFVVLLPRGNP
ncbi:MAG: hypothetical protein MUP64_14090 [Anaerolineae bacterium]|nr:hypothetical protein [Anaerolineae bacterium]